MPPPAAAALPASVLLMTFKMPVLLRMPPPLLFAELPASVLLMTVTVPVLTLRIAAAVVRRVAGERAVGDGQRAVVVNAAADAASLPIGNGQARQCDIDPGA